jgi:hypothetical protein
MKEKQKHGCAILHPYAEIGEPSARSAVLRQIAQFDTAAGGQVRLVAEVALGRTRPSSQADEA